MSPRKHPFNFPPLFPSHLIFPRRRRKVGRECVRNLCVSDVTIRILIAFCSKESETKNVHTKRHNNKFDSALFRSWAGDLCLTNWTVSDEKIVTFFFRSGFCCCFPSFGLNASTRTHGGKQQSFRFSSEKGKVNKTNANDHDNGW